MSQETTHASLLSRVRDPLDAEAWHAFDAKYRELILRYCRQRGLQPTDAEDTRQVVLMSLARRLRSFRYQPDLGRFRDYLGRIVRNAIAKRMAAKGGDRVVYTDELDDLAQAAGADASDPDEGWEREWMYHHFRQAMDHVRDAFEEKSVRIFERLIDGGTVEDLAREYDTTAAAIYKIKERIRTRLRDRIQLQVREEEWPERLLEAPPADRSD